MKELLKKPAGMCKVEFMYLAKALRDAERDSRNPYRKPVCVSWVEGGKKWYGLKEPA